MGGFCLFPVLVVKMNRNNMEKEEKDIRFVARFYRENRLNTTKAWQKLGIRKERNHATLLYRLTAIAAVVGLIAGFSWWWMYDRQDWIVIASPTRTVKEITLPDDSRITLAENSTLRYDRKAYGKKNRNVALDGKAYFSVVHQEQCPFTVQTELANIQVLGTRFQVTAKADQTSATVESGKVLFYNKTSLKKVVEELEAVYKVHINRVPQETHYLTTSFDNIPVEEIIEIINQTLDTKLDITK